MAGAGKGGAHRGAVPRQARGSSGLGDSDDPDESGDTDDTDATDVGVEQGWDGGPGEDLPTRVLIDAGTWLSADLVAHHPPRPGPRPGRRHGPRPGR